MSTLKTDAVTGATLNGDLNLSGNGTGKVNLATGAELNGTALTSTFLASGGSGDGSGLTDLNATNLASGTVPDARFPATLPAASGVNLTALNATNLGSGTLPDARFPATLPAASGANLTSLAAAAISAGTVSEINLKDYGEITNAIGSIGGGTQDFDISLGNNVTATVDTGTTTFTFSNPTASDELCGFTLFLTNGGSQTVNWPGSVDFPGGTAPTLTAAGLDILVFVTTDGGTIYHGMAASLDSKTPQQESLDA